MDSKIIFLGTAGDSHVIGKQVRASGGIVIQSEGLQFHIDPGPGSLVRAAQFGINLRETTALLVSNANVYYSSDINAVIDAMTLGGIDKTGVLITNSSVVNGNDKFTPVLSKTHKSYMERIITLEKGQRVGVESIEIDALPAISNDPKSIGFKLLSPSSTIIYTSDTKYRAELINAYKDADVIIFNISAPEESDNLSSEDVIKIMEHVKPKLALISGFGLKMIKSDPLYEARRIQQATGIQTIAAKDGMSINASPFSSKARQQTLKPFTKEPSSKEEPLVEEKEEDTSAQSELSNDSYETKEEQ